MWRKFKITCFCQGLYKLLPDLRNLEIEPIHHTNSEMGLMLWQKIKSNFLFQIRKMRNDRKIFFEDKKERLKIDVTKQRKSRRKGKKLEGKPSSCLYCVFMVWLGLKAIKSRFAISKPCLYLKYYFHSHQCPKFRLCFHSCFRHTSEFYHENSSRSHFDLILFCRSRGARQYPHSEYFLII